MANWISEEEMARMHADYLAHKIQTFVEEDTNNVFVIYMKDGTRVAIGTYIDDIVSFSVTSTSGAESYIVGPRSSFTMNVHDSTIDIHIVGRGFVSFDAEDIETIV